MDDVCGKAGWSVRLEQGKHADADATTMFNGGELLSSPSPEMEASMKRRHSLLKSMDVLNGFVLDDFEITKL